MSRFKPALIAGIAAASVAGMVGLSKPADAHVFFSVGVGVPVVGAYGYPYYAGYPYPYAYGYPGYYGYGYGAPVVVGGGWGWHGGYGWRGGYGFHRHW